MFGLDNFFGHDPNSKNKQMALYQTKKLLNREEHHQENKKATCGMGEGI